MPDSLNNNFAVIAADGSVQFVFQGVIHAQGLILDAWEGGAPTPDANSLLWERVSDGAITTALSSLLATNNEQTFVVSRSPNPDPGEGNSQLALQARKADVNPGQTGHVAAQMLVEHFASAGGFGTKNVLEMHVASDDYLTDYQRYLLDGLGRSSWVQDYVNQVPVGSVSNPLKGLDCFSGYWLYAAPPADFANRFFAAAVNPYFDNGVLLHGSAMGVADGIVNILQDGVYLVMILPGNASGGVSGSYSGAHVYSSSVGHFTIGVNTAQTVDSDGFTGGGSGHFVRFLPAGSYLRAEGWQSNGLQLYMYMTVLRLPL